MDKRQNEINQLTHDDKQQKVVWLDKEQLQTLHKLTNAYGKLNDEALELNRKLVQMTNQTLRPGIGPVNDYNECMKSIARVLIDYGFDQLV
ncbi:unnamed protein product [Rotaria sp. Silwood2]|nr:unnamed protein product [Rotaria sp. Silwood2]